VLTPEIGKFGVSSLKNRQILELGEKYIVAAVRLDPLSLSC